METMKKFFENLAGKMDEKEKEKWMEQCLLFMEGQRKDKDRERDGKKKGETACSPDRDGVAGCCPEMMEQFFNRVRDCLDGKRREDEDDKEKTGRAKCCV